MGGEHGAKGSSVRRITGYRDSGILAGPKSSI